MTGLNRFTYSLREETIPKEEPFTPMLSPENPETVEDRVKYHRLRPVRAMPIVA